MLAPPSHFRFQETSILCKKKNGYLFNCYPQMRKYPSSSPHDDFPSKVSSQLELSPHTPLAPSLHLSFSLSVLLFLIYCYICSHRNTHLNMQTHRLSGYPVGRGLWIPLTTTMFRSSLQYFALNLSRALHFYSHTHTHTAWHNTTQQGWLIGHK